MSVLYLLLRILETLPQLSATKADWRIGTGDAYAIVEDLLTPTGEIAERMPCKTHLLGLHYHEIVEYSDGTVEAVLMDDYQDCPPFPVERHERAIVKPDMPELLGRLCQALALDPETEGLSLPRGTYELGCHYPVKAYRFPAVLALKPTDAGVEDSLNAAAVLKAGPFIFLTATPARFSDRAKTLSADRDILVSSLSKSLLRSDNCLRATDEWTDKIRAFDDRIVPKPEPAKVFFPTPPHATWYDVSIRFVDGYTVYITVAGVTGRYTYTEMDMANLRSSTPSVQWKFLEKIAGNHRTIDPSIGEFKKNKDWKYSLSNDLRAFFGIDGDPFEPYDYKHKCWEAKFQVYPVAD